MSFVRFSAALPAFACLVTVLLIGCSPSRLNPEPSTVTVEGVATVRGNEPFTRLILTTDQRNSYVLAFGSDAQRAAMQQGVPARVVVQGRLYGEDWQGKRWAHIEVETWQPADG